MHQKLTIFSYQQISLAFTVQHMDYFLQYCIIQIFSQDIFMHSIIKLDLKVGKWYLLKLQNKKQNSTNDIDLIRISTKKVFLTQEREEIILKVPFVFVLFCKKAQNCNLAHTVLPRLELPLDQYALPNSTNPFKKNSVIVRPLDQYAPVNFLNAFWQVNIIPLHCVIDKKLVKFRIRKFQKEL